MQRGRGSRGRTQFSGPPKRGTGWSQVFGSQSGSGNSNVSGKQPTDVNAEPSQDSNATESNGNNSAANINTNTTSPIATTQTSSNNNNNNTNNTREPPQKFAYVPKAQQQEKRAQKQQTFQEYCQGHLRETLAKMPGLSFVDKFITEDEEKNIVAQLDAHNWETELIRRVQQFGYRFYYESQTIDFENMPPPMPECLKVVAQRLVDKGYFNELPDAVIVNEYYPGQGINPHVDKPCFEEAVASISMLSPVVMEFRHTRAFDRAQLLLPPQSLLVLKGDARYSYTHGIPKEEVQTYGPYSIERARRISLTFRNIKKSLLQQQRQKNAN